MRQRSNKSKLTVKIKMNLILLLLFGLFISRKANVGGKEITSMQEAYVEKLIYIYSTAHNY